MIGEPDIIPRSFKKAIIDPEKVIAPIEAPIDISIKLEILISPGEPRLKAPGFKKAAIDLSISETALSGGNLGWISENVIAQKFKSNIIKTPIGQVSEPIFLPNGIFFFKVEDKRKVKQFEDLEKVKNQLVDAEKNKILQMHSLSHYDGIRRTIAINYY